MSYPAREGSGPERLHDTCVDVSAVNEPPGSAWICVRACAEAAPEAALSATEAVQEPSAGGNGWAEGAGIEPGRFEVSGTSLDDRDVQVLCRCGWSADLDAYADLAELVRRAGEHTEVCK